MNSESTVGQLVVDRPARARVFEKFGIDYCCGGKKPLAQACQDDGIDLQQVLSALDIADTVPAPSERNWAEASLTDLADHIEQTHHAYMKEEMPRLVYLIDRVVRAHGAHHPELAQVQEVFAAFKAELDQHMIKEEQILFPICRQLDASAPLPEFHCGSVANPIRVMVSEHDNAGQALATMRSLTHDFTPPEGACNTYRAMLDSLAHLEADMHQHVHKENNILFPKAVQIEARLNEQA